MVTHTDDEHRPWHCDTCGRRYMDDVDAYDCEDDHDNE